jgi:hypothetical protein
MPLAFQIREGRSLPYISWESGGDIPALHAGLGGETPALHAGLGGDTPPLLASKLVVGVQTAESPPMRKRNRALRAAQLIRQK